MENTTCNKPTTLNEVLEILSEKPRAGLTRVYNRYTCEVEDIKLGPLNKIGLAILGYTKVENRRYEGWTGENPFYAYKSKEGEQAIVLLDYPHGYAMRLDSGIRLPTKKPEVVATANNQQCKCGSTCNCSDSDCSK
jgi:hypothetical protein